MTEHNENPSPGTAGGEQRRPSTGGCACGGVRFEIRGRLSPVTICHCSQCRRFHGAAGPYATCKREKLSFLSDRTLAWYRSSLHVRRGFCRECGASMFYSRDDSTFSEIAVGALDEPTGLTVSAHIFVASRADWEHLEDGLPRHDESIVNSSAVAPGAPSSPER